MKIFFFYIKVIFGFFFVLFFKKRNLWSDFDVEPKDEFLAKLLYMDNLFRDGNLPPVATLDQTNDHSHDLQKRGRRK